MLTKHETLSIKREAAGFLASLPDRDPSNFRPHQASWADLNAIERDARSNARRLLDMTKDGIPDERAAELEIAFDALSQIADACVREKDERNERGDRNPHAGIDLSKRPRFEPRSAPAVDGGDMVEDEAEAFFLAPEQRFRKYAEARGADSYGGLNVGRYLRAMAMGGQTGAERRALSEGSDSAGGYTVPTTLAADIIDRLRAQSVVNRAGARMVPLSTNSHSIAKLLTDPTPAWRNEAGAIAESDPTFGQVTFVPQSLAVIVKVSRELLDDSLNVGSALPDVLTKALALELDRVALFGTGTAPEPRGVANTSGISSNALGASLTSYAPLVTARTSLLTANAGEPSAIIMHPRDEGTFAGLTDSTGQPLNMPPRLSGVPILTTTQIPTDGGAGSDESTIFVADFRRLMIGMRQDIRVEVLKERYAENHQYAFIAHMRADVAVEQPAAFHKITGVQG